MPQGMIIGSTFPLSLIRRPCEITPIRGDGAAYLNQVRSDILQNGYEVASFWGHTNTLAAAKQFLGFDVTPRTERPSLVLNENNLPVLEGITTHFVYVVSPNYRPGFRPQIGVEVTSEEILGWEVLVVYFF